MEIFSLFSFNDIPKCFREHFGITVRSQMAGAGMEKNQSNVKKIAVTGGAGQIAYQLLFRIASGEMFPGQPISLHILELPEAMKGLEGVAMELEDGAFPWLRSIHLGSDPREIFADVDYALLVGAKPRSPGMERKELLQENGKIFIAQGKALNDVASSDVRVFVVGNPCNTNCLIAMRHAPRIPKHHFHAMTRLDQNRAVAQLSKRAGVEVSAVTQLAIWGNHSTTQVPDFFNARIEGYPIIEKIPDTKWLEGDFLSTVQQRGAAIISARGKSSAASAASALIDAVRDIHTKTPAGQWFSSAVYSAGNPYGIDEDLVFSFPCRSNGQGDWQFVAGLPWDFFLEKRIRASEKELIEERALLEA